MANLRHRFPLLECPLVRRFLLPPVPPVPLAVVLVCLHRCLVVFKDPLLEWDLVAPLEVEVPVDFLVDEAAVVDGESISN